jgi:hypothetical protein
MDTRTEEWKRDRTPLPPVDIVQHSHLALSRETAGHAPKLLHHYQAVESLERKYGRRQEWCFLIKPCILVGGVVILRPWYGNGYDEARRFVEVLRRPENGPLFTEEDESWGLDIYATEGRLHFRSGNPCDDEVDVLISVDRGHAQQAAFETLRRAGAIVDYLLERMDQDRLGAAATPGRGCPSFWRFTHWSGYT